MSCTVFQLCCRIPCEDIWPWASWCIQRWGCWRRGPGWWCPSWIFLENWVWVRPSRNRKNELNLCTILTSQKISLTWLRNTGSSSSQSSSQLPSGLNRCVSLQLTSLDPSSWLWRTQLRSNWCQLSFFQMWRATLFRLNCVNICKLMEQTLSIVSVHFHTSVRAWIVYI